MGNIDETICRKPVSVAIVIRYGRAFVAVVPLIIAIAAECTYSKFEIANIITEKDPACSGFFFYRF